MAEVKGVISQRAPICNFHPPSRTFFIRALPSCSNIGIPDQIFIRCFRLCSACNAIQSYTVSAIVRYCLHSLPLFDEKLASRRSRVLSTRCLIAQNFTITRNRFFSSSSLLGKQVLQICQYFSDSAVSYYFNLCCLVSRRRTRVVDSQIFSSTGVFCRYREIDRFFTARGPFFSSSSRRDFHFP